MATNKKRPDNNTALPQSKSAKRRISIQKNTATKRPIKHGGAPVKDDAIHVSREDLLSFKLGEQTIRRVQAELRDAQKDLQILVHNFEKAKEVLQQNIQRLRDEADCAHEQHSELWLRLAKLYGFEPTCASIDDVTGRIHEH